MRNYGSPDQDGVSGHREKWTNLRSILVIESVIFITESDGWEERERKGSSKMMLRSLCLHKGGNGGTKE